MRAFPVVLRRFYSQLKRAFDLPPAKHRPPGIFGLTRSDLPAMTNQCEIEARRIRHSIKEDRLDEAEILRSFDNLSECICKVADLMEFLRHCGPYRNDAALQHARLSRLVNEFNTDRDLYLKLSEVAASSGLSPVERRLYLSLLQDFQQSGIHLDNEKREQFVDLQDRLNILSLKFLRGCQLERPMDGLSSCSREREKSYRAFYSSEDEQQIRTFEQILEHRFRIATLCGYSSYAERALQGMLLNTPEKALSFLTNLVNGIRPELRREYALLEGGNDSVKVWDLQYLIDHHPLSVEYRKNWPSAYFSLGTCLDGLDKLLRDRYNVSIKVDLDSEDVWHPSVVKMRVEELGSSAAPLGIIYADLIARPEKETVDCHFTIRCTRKVDDQRQVPVIVIHMNFPPGSDTLPILLSRDMVESLFHEFGHALHSCLSMTAYQHLSGTRCSTDLAEAPSQLFEYMVRDGQVLRQIGSHYLTKEPPPSSCSLCAKDPFRCFEMAEQALMSIADLLFHLDPKMATDRTWRKDRLDSLYRECMLLPFPEDTAPYIRFLHLIDYGSKYHSYLVSKSIARQLISMRNSGTLKDESIRWLLLAKGGEISCSDLVSFFPEIDLDSLVDSLVEEVNG